jgi:hypothetical protein
MTQPMDEQYRQLLHSGFLFLREATAARNLDWVNAEIEFLHNVPSLISESNWLRHEYFLVGERSMYLEWAARANIPLQQTLMKNRYVPIWEELEKIFKSRGTP